MAVEYAKQHNIILKTTCFEEKGKSAQSICLYNDVSRQLIQKEGGLHAINLDVGTLAPEIAAQVISRVSGQYSELVQAAVYTAVLVRKYFSGNNAHYYIPARIQAHQDKDGRYTGKTAFLHAGIVRPDSPKYSVIFSLMPRVTDFPDIPTVSLKHSKIEIANEVNSVIIETEGPEKFFGSNYGHGWKLNVKNDQGMARSLDISVGPTGFVVSLDSGLRSFLNEKKSLTANISGKWGFDDVQTTHDFTLTLAAPQP